MSERDEALKEAWDMSLVELVKQILFESYTPGLEDEVLLERARVLDDAS
jgi:hypothetical protein